MKTKKKPAKKKPVSYLFEVGGGFMVSPRLKPNLDASGVVSGFTLPDGSVADLAVCIRVEKKGREKWIVSEKEMEELGVQLVDYSRADFIEE